MRCFFYVLRHLLLVALDLSLGAGIVFTMSWLLPVSAMSPLLPVSTSQVDGLASARLHHRGAAAAKASSPGEERVSGPSTASARGLPPLLVADRRHPRPTGDCR